MSATELCPYGMSAVESSVLDAYARACDRLNLAIGPFARDKARAGIRGAYGRVVAFGLLDALTPAQAEIAREAT